MGNCAYCIIDGQEVPAVEQNTSSEWLCERHLRQFEHEESQGERIVMPEGP